MKSSPEPHCQPKPESLVSNVDHDDVQAELARYLSHPAALQAACDESGANSICDGEQLRRLRLFRGFITKVKHNALRRAIPCTLRLISGPEIRDRVFCHAVTGVRRIPAARPDLQ